MSSDDQNYSRRNKPIIDISIDSLRIKNANKTQAHLDNFKHRTLIISPKKINNQSDSDRFEIVKLSPSRVKKNQDKTKTKNNKN